MKYLIPFMLLGSCGRSTPKLPKYSFDTLTVKEVALDWIFWCTWAGSACVIVGVILLIWTRRKDTAIRIIITGFALNLTAKAMLWFENHEWIVWLTIGLSFTAYCVFNPMWTEKILSKFGLRFDLNGDGYIGTPTMWFKKSESSQADPEPTPTDWEADTEIINSD